MEQEPAEDAEADPSGAEDNLDKQDNIQVSLEPQKRPEEVKKKLDENFFYTYEDVYSGPYATDDTEIPTDLLVFKHSFGYDCTRPVNLMVMDKHTVGYVAGNQVILQNLRTKYQKHVRSSCGGGIGFITAHPSKEYFAVGEKGKKPNIVIYTYPSVRPYRILKGGTEIAYVFGDFNRTGTFLASVGSSPDYMLTIWDWKQEETLLRSKAFAQDVYRVMFSAENEEHLTTGGSGHIRFWKMALTLTGLKLQGALGRFGKTAVSDITGFVELPDGKVVSGTEWGNLLLWEGGLIKVELCQVGRKPCHEGPVSQLVFEEGDLYSVGKDGVIRMWNFEVVDTADRVDDTGLVEMEPMNELWLGKNVSLNFITKIHDHGQSFWFAQDTSGAIWKLDLTFSNMSHDPERMCTFHSGGIEAIGVSPFTYLMATTALDRSVRIYDFSSNSQLSVIKFKQGGTALAWAPAVVNPEGGLIAVGFEDGVVRIIEVYDPKLLPGHAGQSNEIAEINLKQVFKPHGATVTALAYAQKGSVLATGSKDKTVFFFAIEDEYKPVGFICVPGPVQALQWSPPSYGKSTLLILCKNGFAVQVPAPPHGKKDKVTTYHLKNLPKQYFHFYSIKSQIKLKEEIARREKEKQEKEKARLEWINQQKELGLEVEETKEEEPEEEPLPPVYIPEESSPILCGFYSAPGKFWLSLGGYDSGFLYHCEFSHGDKEDPEKRRDEPFEVIPMEDTDNNPIHQISFCTRPPLMICGMQDGSLRAYPLSEKGLSVGALKDYWYLNVHDNDNGQIRGICCSHNDRCLITCGGDGNIFTFDLLSEEELPKELKIKIPPPRRGLEKEKATEDIKDPDAYTIEQYKQKKEHERKMKEAEEKKHKKREELSALRQDFVVLLQKNQELPKHMQLHREEFEMDRRIFEELDRQTLQRIQLVQKQLAWEHEKQLIGLQKLQTQFRDSLEFALTVHAIQSNHQISTYSLLRVSEKYTPDKKRVDSKWTVLKEKWTALKEVEQAEEEIPRQIGRVHRGSVVFENETERLKTPEVQKPTTRYIESRRQKIRRLVEKYDALKAKIMKRRAEWQELYKSKPRHNHENSKDAEEIKEARENIGCYRLKSATNYTLTEGERISTEKKMVQLGVLEDLIHKAKESMNKEIVSLRDLKVSTIDEIKSLVKQVKSIQANLDASEHLPIPLIPQLHPDEVPEKIVEYNTDVLLKFKEEQEAKEKLKEPLEECLSSRAFRHVFLQTPPVEEGDPMAQAGDASAVVTEQQEAFEMEKAEPTEMELEILKREKIKNLYLQETLIKKINTLVINFDAELRLLRHKKLKMDVQMKSADLRCITCCEELLILKKLEIHEDLLEEKISALINKQENIHSKLKSCLAQMEDRKCEIVMLEEREKALYASFKASLGEDNEFADVLTDILKKKIECVEKKEVGREAGKQNENEEKDGEKPDLKTDEKNCGSESIVFDDSVCPEGCSEDLFLNTIQLRQQRISIEKALKEEKKAAASLKKEHNALAIEAKEIETSLDTTKRELEEFQWEKLHKLNELDVVVPLRLHQVQCLVDGEMPRDFSQTLVFTNQSLQYLKNRIVDLRNEKIMQREIHKKAKEQHKQLLQEKKEMEMEIQGLEERCNNLMMEKFGRLVDFEAVQVHSVNIPMEQMKVRIMEKEYENFMELKEWEERIVLLQHQLTKLTRENTSKLHQLNRFCHEKHQLETELESLTTGQGGEFEGTRSAEIKETARLESRLMHVTGEVALLKEEISQGRVDRCKELAFLSRKGGCLFLQALPQDSETSTPCSEIITNNPSHP
ncbi:LOW QUALITY PROTEIN: cilia- and flagella-associated protein 44 [Onychostruthus taczanowskii]|uniref:LOW QUALITY PROTEIN: cilia- and flagella-associated protein 44 n=1 Tax=Onychostruthus taczanowskii TaxID=356909 RepID=UPI001B805565|nr:LOW QUALITY PROTEIN: cilia- and flagella-associated protein 44 [Onychostruthus taczanowskii]